MGPYPGDGTRAEDQGAGGHPPLAGMASLLLPTTGI